MVKFRLPFWVLVCLLVLKLAYAQQNACQIDFPVGIVGTDGSLLEGLAAGDVTVRWGKQTLPIETVDYNKGPRRVLFVLDTSYRLPGEVRRAEVLAVKHILGHAREGDLFALETTRGALRQVRFEDGPEALQKAVEELGTDPKEPKKAANVLDAIFESAGWFGSPRMGDAMILMADHLEESQVGSKIQGGIATDVGPNFEGSKVSFKTVAETIAARRIRVFGLQFGALNLNSSTYEPSDQNLLGLALGSGGTLLLDSMDPHGGYVLTEARMQSLEHKTFQLYGMAAQFYVLRMNAPPTQPHASWNLELAKDLQKNTRALYPRRFDPCAASKSD